MLIKRLSLIFLLPIILLSQENKLDLDLKVLGVLTRDDGSYLILEQGVIQINKTDPYTEYYRQIYNDSTLISPNSEIKTEYELNLIPYILPNPMLHRIDFDEPLDLGIFIRMNEVGKLNFTSFGTEILDSLITQ